MGPFQMMRRVFDLATSYLVDFLRLLSGSTVGPIGPRPALPLVLYEFESCPYCKKVREALTMLDLDADIRPCPNGGRRFRDDLIKRGGKAQFPYLVDPNADVGLYESDAIIRHLYRQYGAGDAPLALRLGPLTDLASALALVPRRWAGRRSRPSRAPAQPLELYGMEMSPYCRLVREALCALELPYRLHNVGKESPSRAGFVQRSGKQLLPWLVDPNTDTELFESADIVRYLHRTYAR